MNPLKPLKLNIIRLLIVLIIGTVASQYLIAVLFRAMDSWEQSALSGYLQVAITMLLGYFFMRLHYRFKVKSSAVLGLIVVLIYILYDVFNQLGSLFPIYTWERLSTALIAGIAPGINEEIIVRGTILPAIAREFKSKTTAIYGSVIASGLIFGLLHLFNWSIQGPTQTLIQVGYAGIIGIFFGSLYVATGSLWFGIILHAVTDISAFYFAGVDATSSVEGNGAYLSLIIMCVLYLILAVMIMIMTGKDKMMANIQNMTRN